MRIGIWAYLDNNFGDDLMVKLLADRFCNHTFIIYSDSTEIKHSFKKQPNIVLKGTNEQKTNCSDIDLFLTIGGSIFNDLITLGGYLRRIQKILYLMKLKRQKVKIATLGCNLGPYKGRIGPFLTRHELLLNDLITVRDRASYDQIKSMKKIKNYHLADDIGHLHLYQGVEANNRKGLGISAYRSTQKKINYENYEAIANLCDEYIKKTGEGVVLFAFNTGSENDLSAAHHIYSLALCKSSIEIIPYLGDIDEFVKEISKCRRFIAIRFHAMIIALNQKIPFLPVVYADKMRDYISEKMNSEAIDLQSLAKSCEEYNALLNNVLIDNAFVFDFDCEYNSSLHFMKLADLIDL